MALPRQCPELKKRSRGAGLLSTLQQTPAIASESINNPASQSFSVERATGFKTATGHSVFFNNRSRNDEMDSIP
jgi:hypothetical protein